MEEYPKEIAVDVVGLHHNVIEDFFVGASPKSFLIEPSYPGAITWKFNIEEELDKEIGRIIPKDKALRHPLADAKCHAFANYGPSDDVLFYITGKPDHSFAVVHLTWKGAKENNVRYPLTEFYTDFEDFRAKRMEPDNLDWE